MDLYRPFPEPVRVEWYLDDEPPQDKQDWLDGKADHDFERDNDR